MFNRLLPGLIAIFYTTLPALAHQGLESSVEVRLLTQGTDVVLRTVPAVASFVLGKDAPPEWTEKSIAENKAAIIEHATHLLALCEGDRKLSPKSIRVIPEFDGHIVFIFSYPPTMAWPLKVEAAYFENLGPEFTGTMKVYGIPTTPIERHGPMIGHKELTASTRSLIVESP